MKNIKEAILKLRKDGLSYRGIAKELNITRCRVEYHCNPKRLQQARDAYKRYFSKHPIQKKVANFHASIAKDKRIVPVFGYNEFLEKIGPSPTCALTGDPIDILNPDIYSIDHIIPVSKGGLNNLENAALVTKDANRLKMDKPMEELYVICYKVLKHANKI